VDLSRNTMLAAIQSGDWQLRATLRAVFRRSFYACVKCVTCFNEPVNLMDAEVYKESCDWIQWVVTTKKRGLLEDPRGFIKSTRVARGIPEWYAIQVPHEKWDLPEEYDRAARFIDDHPHMRGPDGRLILGCDSKERAAKFIGSSKTDWDSNPMLRFLAPELIWPNSNRVDYGQWQNAGYSLAGRRNPSTPDLYLSAVGIDSKAQGGRADGIIIDDLVGETSYKSSSELERRQDWCRSISFLLENKDQNSPQGGFVLYDGNRWALDDVNSMYHNEFDDWAIWHRAGFKCIIHGFGNCGRWADNEERDCAITNEPLWKARYPDEESMLAILTDLGKGERAEELFAAQILNDPTTASELNVADFRDFRMEPATVPVTDDRTIRTWCVVIPVTDDNDTFIRNETIPLSALSDHVVSIDPADSKDPKNARTCVSWFALDRPTARVFWLDLIADHWSASEATDNAYAFILRVADKLGSRPRVLIEKVACQGYFGAALRLAAQRDPRGRQFVPVPEMIPPARGLSKDDRIRRRTGHRMGQRLLYLRKGLMLPRWEVRHFPTGTKDALDTHAQAEEVYLEATASLNSDKLARGRARRRARRRAQSTTTGVPL